MKTFLHRRINRISIFFFTLFSIVFSSTAQEPVDYTLTVGDITISNGILTACSYNFEGNADGTNLIIPDDLGIIGIIDAETDLMGDFTGNPPFVDKNIRSLSLPSTLVKIGDFSFSKNNLVELTIPEGVEIIGDDAFFQNNLSNIVIPGSVKSIGANAFHSNTTLTNVTFLDNSHLVFIGSHAFECTLVESIELPTPIVPDNNFEYWIKFDSNKTTHGGGENVKPNHYQFVAKFFYSLTEEDVVIENGIITSCNYDFSGRYISIPSELNGIQVIGIANSSNQNSGIFYDKSLLGLKLPSTIETIGNFSFNSNSIERLIIPASVKTIGNYAFWRSVKESIVFEDESKLSSIGFKSFDNNGSLKVLFPTPVKDGYLFNKWVDDYDDYSTFDGGVEIPNYKTSYTAHFTIVTGVFENNLSDKEIIVHPNPVQNNLIINSNGKYIVELIDVKGIRLSKKQASSTIEIDMSDKVSGVYILRFISEDEVITKKIIKE